MARSAVCMCALWVASFSACAHAQDRNVSQRSQVVLIARLPDAFGVNPQDAGASSGGTQPETTSTGIALHAVAQLIPGTNATTACFVQGRFQGRASAASRTGGLGSERNVPSTVGVALSCDGSFQNLPGRLDSIAIEARGHASGKRRATKRIDVIFSIF